MNGTSLEVVRSLVARLQQAGLSNSRIRELCAVLLLCRWAEQQQTIENPIWATHPLRRHRELLRILATHFAARAVGERAAASPEQGFLHLMHLLATSSRSPAASHADCLRTLADILGSLGHLNPSALADATSCLSQLRFEGRSTGCSMLQCFDEIDRITSESRSQFFTPRAWLRTLLQDLSPDRPVADPPDCNAGSAHFMTFAAQQLLYNLLINGGAATGVHDVALNAHEFLLGLTRFVLDEPVPRTSMPSTVRTATEGLAKRAEGFAIPRADLILSNPPFGAVFGRQLKHRSGNRTSCRDPERFFIECILQQLAPGGRACVLVPSGFLYRDGPARRLRRELVERGALEGVISLPRDIFSNATGVRAAILLLRGRSAEAATHDRAKRVLLIDAAAASRSARQEAGPAFRVLYRPEAAMPMQIYHGRADDGPEVPWMPCPGWSVEAAELAACRWRLSVEPREQGSLQWLWTPLGEVLRARSQVWSLGQCAELRVGIYIKKNHLGEASANESAPGYLRIADLRDGIAQPPALRVLPSAGGQIRHNHLLRPGDVLLSRSGTVDRAAVVHSDVLPAMAGGGLYVIRTDERQLDPEFLVAYLHSRASSDWLKAQSVRTVLPNLTLATMNRMAVPTPPLAIQSEAVVRSRKMQADLLTSLSELLDPSGTSHVQNPCYANHSGSDSL